MLCIEFGNFVSFSGKYMYDVKFRYFVNHVRTVCQIMLFLIQPPCHSMS